MGGVEVETMGVVLSCVDCSRGSLLKGMDMPLDDLLSSVSSFLSTRHASGGQAGFGNNFPLRGFKDTEFEGGVRVPAFVTGPLIPKSMRGKAVDGYMHICDWYATLASIVNASIVDRRAKAARLPPVDSLNMWPMITGRNQTSPRVEIPISGGPHEPTSSLIHGNHKLIRGTVGGAVHTSIFQPNSSVTVSKTRDFLNCSAGCLFDIQQDPCEYLDISKNVRAGL